LKRLRSRSPLEILRQRSQRIDELVRIIQSYGSYIFDKKKNRLESLEQRLKSLDPYDIMRRGYSITTSYSTGKIIKNCQEVLAGGKIITLLNKGKIVSIIDENIE